MKLQIDENPFVKNNKNNTIDITYKSKFKISQLPYEMSEFVF